MSKGIHKSDSTGLINYRGHITELDAMRAFAIGLVLLDHFWRPSFSLLIYQFGQFAWMAMDCFFVLSGFLITGILVDAKTRNDYFRNYYTRRALRIFPLYYAVLAAIYVIAHLARIGSGSEYANMLQTWGSPVWYVFYLGNVHVAWVKSMPPVSAYGPLWSLQIEEQFYLLLPFAVRWLSLKQLTRFMWVLVFLSPLCRVLFYLRDPNNAIAQYVLLPCHMGGLALGSLIAIRLRSGPWRVPKRPLAALAAGVLLTTCICARISGPTNWLEGRFNRLVGFSMSSFGFALVLLLLISLRGSKYTQILRIAPIRYVAKISYGVYLLHLIASRCLRATSKIGIHIDPNSFTRFVAVVTLSFLFAAASWHFFELPLVSLKNRIAPRHVDPAAAVPS